MNAHLVRITVLCVGAAVLLSTSASAARTEQYRSCKVVHWRHGFARQLLEHGIGCRRARNTIRYALDHGMAKPAPWYKELAKVSQRGYFEVARRHVDGFRFAYRGFDFRTFFVAYRSNAWVEIDLCWVGVDC